MIYQGRVRDGKIVLDPPVELPEGAPVSVEYVTDEELDPAFRIGELAEPTGIPDLGVNIDHYLYGHPKATEADAE